MIVAVILGNRMNDDGSLSKIMLDRLELAKRLIAERSPDKVILSGGIANKNAGVSEADAMERWLIGRGVDKNILMKEDKSLTTKQNAKYSVPTAVAVGAEKIILCTSKEHIERGFLNPVKLFQKRLKGYGVSLEVFTNK